MNIEDTLYYISSYLNDYNSINNFCQINQLNNKLCSQPHFWINLFEKNNYNLPEPLPQTKKEWLRSFYAIQKTNFIINYIKNNKGSTKYSFNQINKNPNYFLLLQEFNITKLYIITYLEKLIKKNKNIIKIDINYSNFTNTFTIFFYNTNNNFDSVTQLNQTHITQFLYNALYDNAIND